MILLEETRRPPGAATLLPVSPVLARLVKRSPNELLCGTFFFYFIFLPGCVSLSMFRMDMVLSKKAEPQHVHTTPTSQRVIFFSMAAQEGEAAVVVALLKAGASVNKARRSGATPLYLAAQNGNLAVVFALINRKLAQILSKRGLCL